jgi:tRNA(His) 5'-end guanylyltransferase
MRREGFAEHLEHFEVLADRELMPGFPAVARLRVRDLDALVAALANGAVQSPYDPGFAKMMIKTASHLLVAGTGAVYAFAEREEISALVAPTTDDDDDARDARELLVRLVSECSAKLSLLSGAVATVEGRLYEFPNPQLALEYFRWRQDQAQKRALDRYCAYVLAHKSGQQKAEALKVLDGMAEDEKVEILRNSDIDFDRVPSWQRRGAGVFVRKPNGTGGEEPRLVVDPELPCADAYTEYLKRFFFARL